MKRLSTFLAAAAIAAGGLIGLGAAPASATSPCDSWLEVKSLTGNGYLEMPGLSSGSTYCHLQRGNSSRAVTILQETFNRCYADDLGLDLGHGGGVHIGVDGNFGPETETAMRRVQAYHGISADGVYGPNTRNAMVFGHIDQTSGCFQYN